MHEEVDAGELLHDLEADGEDDAVQVAVVAHGEGVLGGAAGHLQDGVFDLEELGADVLVGGVQVVEGGEDVEGFVLAAFEDEPAGGLGEVGQDEEHGHHPEDLAGDGEAPGRGVGLCPCEAKVDPVGHGDAKGDAGAGTDHQHAAAAMSLCALGLPGGGGGGVEAERG